MCTVLLPQGVNPIAVDKYTIIIIIFPLWNQTSTVAAEHFDFPTVEPNIYSSSTAISWTVTGGNRRGRGRCEDW